MRSWDFQPCSSRQHDTGGSVFADISHGVIEVVIVGDLPSGGIPLHPRQSLRPAGDFFFKPSSLPATKPSIDDVEGFSVPAGSRRTPADIQIFCAARERRLKMYFCQHWAGRRSQILISIPFAQPIFGFPMMKNSTVFAQLEFVSRQPGFAGNSRKTFFAFLAAVPGRPAADRN